jgi:hypothetical protein
LNEDYILHVTDGKKAISELVTISQILNAVPVTQVHNRPELVMNDGLRLSVQGRKSTTNNASCHPKTTSVGPWTSLEVGFPDRWVARLLPFIEGGEDNPVSPPDQAVYHYVPVEVLNTIVQEAGGCAGYSYEGELVPLGQIRDGLMWLPHSYGYTKYKMVSPDGYHMVKIEDSRIDKSLWEVDGHLYHTVQDAMVAMKQYLLGEPSQY